MTSLRFLMCRFLQARDLCALLGVELITVICLPRTKPGSSQESSPRQVRYLTKGDLLNIASTLKRFGAVNKNQEVDAHYAESK